MVPPFTNIPTYLFFLLLIAALMLNSNQTLATPSNLNSVVLGMKHSSTSLPSPKPSRNSSKRRPSEALDMMEPLREVRDGYLISLNFGTPPQAIQVYMDTGSDLTWVPCGNLSFDCINCDEYKNNIRLTTANTFSPSFSSSSGRDLCGSIFCIDIHSSDNAFDTCTMAGCSLVTLLKATCPRPCPSFAYTYGAGGVVTGALTRDTLMVHGNSPGVTREIPKFCFGCVGSTYREPIGIAGFGRGRLSLPSQLGLLQKGFSHCFLAFKYANNPNISSPLVIGDVAISSKDYLQYTPMLKCPMYPNFYYIGLEGISVGNASAIKVPRSLREIDWKSNGGMLIDSGTTYSHLPEPLYSQLLEVLQSMISYPRATDMEMRAGFDLCYKVPCTNNINFIDDRDLLPSITFHFLNNVSLVLPRGNHFYAMGAPSNSTVVKCLLFQSMDDGDYGPAGVFGSFQQQNVEVVYDLEKERVGFQTRDCALAAAGQGLHKI